MTKRKTQPETTVRRAAIYVRVSSERQGEKVSPETQEADCRALCESKGYQVINIYRDVQKYRVGRKLVEPSGSRADRPGLRAMLAAARAGEFDVIIAWREDRLYRSYRPMLDVLDCLQETGIDIELAKETFDKKMMGGKVWIANMELEAKRDRFLMGVAGRLRQGKAWNQVPPYGYMKDSEGFIIDDPNESQWVVKIWEWYADDVAVLEIRRRLIARGAPRRSHIWKVKRAWLTSRIGQILRADYYHTGKLYMTWDGQRYEITIPTLIDPDTVRRVAERRARFKAYPAGKLKDDRLAVGLVYCPACACGMCLAKGYGRKRKDGTRKIYVLYRCNMHRCTGAMSPPKCARTASAPRIDDEVWCKVWALISQPGELDRRIDARIVELQAEQTDAGAEVGRLEKELADLVDQRQWVITQARIGKITEDDMATQLAALTWQEASARAELSKAQLLTGNRAERLRTLADKYRRDVAAGVALLNTEERTPEQERKVFAFKRRQVLRMVERVDILTDKSTQVHIRVTLDDTADAPGEQDTPTVQQAEGLAIKTSSTH